MSIDTLAFVTRLEAAGISRGRMRPAGLADGFRAILFARLKLA